MEKAAIHERLRAQFGEGVRESVLDVRDPFVVVDPALLLAICRFLRDDPDLRFDALSNLSGVDYKDKGYIEVVYHLFSYPHRHLVVVKARAPRENPVLASVEDVWKAANWHEREVYDLLGVVFEGHSDLRRLLLPEDWVGHPLRKDYVEPEEYHGISTRRESLLR